MGSLKKPLFLSTLSGLLLAASWPTYGHPLFIFFAFIPLFFGEKILRSRGPKVKLKVWANGYLAFLIFNLLTTWWLFYATPFGMLFAVLVNALLMSLLFLMYHIAAKRIPQKRALVFFIAVWLSFEKFHLSWDFSWPWLNLGNVFADYPRWIQWYEFTGTFGGSLWILAVNAIGFYGIEKLRNFSASHIAKKMLPKMALLIAVPIVISMWMYVSYEVKGKTKEVIVLQPNIDPYNEKYDTPNFLIAKNLLHQADSLITPQTDYIIAPETVLAESAPYDNFAYSPAKYLMTNYLSMHKNAELLWGIDTYRFIYNKADVLPTSNIFHDSIWVNFYNAALFINHKPELQKYYKSKLVVGIENMPYKAVLEPIFGNALINLGGTISTKTVQEERTPFVSDDGTKVGPIICYESVYGEYVTGFVQHGANFLAIITNDAWWHDTQGHKQHLTFASLRAIETRRDIARSANTGISAFIDQRGEIVSRTKYGEKAALKGVVHLNDRKTFYVMYGDIIADAAAATFVAFMLYIMVLNRRIRN